MATVMVLERDTAAEGSTQEAKKELKDAKGRRKSSRGLQMLRKHRHRLTRALTGSFADLAKLAARDLFVKVKAVRVAGKVVRSQEELTSALSDWQATMKVREQEMLQQHLRQQYDMVVKSMDAGDIDTQMTAARIAWELATRADFHDVFSVRFAKVRVGSRV